jgi:hypothetical protein
MAARLRLLSSAVNARLLSLISVCCSISKEVSLLDSKHVTIQKYLTYSTNHPDTTAHGGTAICIKRAINHYELTKYKLNHLQATAIKVKMTQYELTVAAVYCPPKHIIKKENFKDFYQTLGPIAE